MWMRMLLVAAAVVAINAKSYCDIYYRHQLCNSDGRPNGRCYGTVAENLQRHVTDEEKKFILDLHNKLRRRVANGQAGNGFPAAANMEKLTWDPELAEIAQAHMNKCIYEHDCKKCKLDKKGCYKGVGQNIAYRSHTTLLKSNWENVIVDWYNEIKNYDNSYKNVEYYGNYGRSASGYVTHFTQMIWAETYKIGCGYIIYKEYGLYKHLYGCNYAHKGNMPGKPMYLKGSACSKCRYDTKCEDSLCAYV